MKWRGTRVLVTGAGGFIGSHLAEALVGLGARTRVLLRYVSSGTAGWLDGSPQLADMEVLRGDVRDPEIAAQACQDMEVVFHLAASISVPYSYAAPRAVAETNVMGTLSMLEASRQRGVGRVIHTSSSEVYGTALTVPITEAHPLQGQSPYAATKIGADKLAESYHLALGLPVVTVRPFNTYGPRQSTRAIIPTIITQALGSGPLGLGALTPTRDFLFVDDTVRGFLAAAEAQSAIGQVVHLGSGVEISIGDLAQRILGILDKQHAIESEAARLRPQTSEVQRLLADSSKAARVLGWKAQVDLDDGLKRTVTWFLEHEKRVLRNQLRNI